MFADKEGTEEPSTKWPYRIPALSSEIPERGVVIVVRPVPVHPSHPVLRLFLHRLHRPVTDISEIDCRGRCAVLTGHLLVMRTEQGNLREWCPMELLASMDRSSPPSTADQCQTHRPPVIGSASAPSNGGDGTRHKRGPESAYLPLTHNQASVEPACEVPPSQSSPRRQVTATLKSV
ncbi:hypothetical protein QQF64_011183 [Cirrhinus molitorella]|uniref:Uncharacterized protein n=1 Tax=Cirrhinus molitorella TaxID=172907 RepID=A0ABR3M1W3_9TELE